MKMHTNSLKEALSDTMSAHYDNDSYLFFCYLPIQADSCIDKKDKFS